MGFGGYGHIQDMINRVKQNAKIRTSARSKFKSYMDNRTFVENNSKLQFKSFSPEDIAKEKARIRQWARKKKFKHLLSILIASIVTFSIFAWAFYTLFRS